MKKIITTSVFLNTFNNREIAIIIWLFLLTIWMLFSKSIRNSLYMLVKAFFQKKIITLFFFMFIYLILIILLLKSIRFWNTASVKDTTIWIIGSAFPLFINLNDIPKDESFFNKSFQDNLKTSVIVEFIINLYSFNLIFELILVPLIVIILMIISYIDVKKDKDSLDNKRVKNFLLAVLSILGIAIIIFTISSIVNNPNDFFSFHNLRDFLLPIVLSIFFIPCIYLISLFIQYSDLFFRYQHSNSNKYLLNYFKKKTIIIFKFHLYKLINFSRKRRPKEFKDRKDVDKLFENQGK